MGSEQIEQKIGYTFCNKSLLTEAITHPSTGHGRQGPSEYERLEFLGDAVLELVVSVQLYAKHPGADEGELTKMRASIVSRHYLAGIADQLGLGEHVVMSSRLESSGGRASASILGNTLESIIGAVMLDAGFETASRVAVQLLRESLNNSCPARSTNPKGDLQELLQAVNGEAPVYRVKQVRAIPAHFVATAMWDGREIGVGEGSGKRKAETAAAKVALEALRAKQGWAEGL